MQKDDNGRNRWRGFRRAGEDEPQASAAEVAPDPVPPTPTSAPVPPDRLDHYEDPGLAEPRAVEASSDSVQPVASTEGESFESLGENPAAPAERGDEHSDATSERAASAQQPVRAERMDAPSPEELAPHRQQDADAARPLPRIIAVANQKGGVGKTTTTINLGAALAEDDHRVLVIDLDPQGNATTGLGLNPRALENSIYDVLLADVPLEDSIEPTSVLNLFIAPASLDLAGAEIELVPAFSRESKLKNAIAEVIEDFDYILVDCPPSLGLLTVNALAAAHEVLVPIQCEYYALEGLGQLIRNINLVQKNLNRDLILGSIVLVMYDGRTNLAEQVSQEVREHFGSLVCRNVIPRNVRLSEAPSYGQPITTFDSASRGAVAYRELAREVHSVST